MTKQEELVAFDEIREQEIELVQQVKTCVEELSKDEDFKDYGKNALFRIDYSLNVLKNNVLPISLFAAFQAGKSTTTSAVADGHEITPCGRAGGGMRTSAVPVTIHNDNFATRVKINLYPKEIITQRIYDGIRGSLLRIFLPNGFMDNYDTNNPEQVRILEEATKKAESCDIDNEDDIKILKKAAQVEINEYREDPRHYNVDNKLELLQTAILSLAFYGSKSYQWIVDREKNGEGFSIEEIQPFLAFETDIETRWSNLSACGFDDVVHMKDEKGQPVFDEFKSMHVFIDNIVIPVHSEFMALTGTAIIDAPGTLVNSFDTKRAIDAARNAAVVIFILDGQLQLTDEDKKMLGTLRDAGMADKVVFAVNFRRNPEIIRTGGIEKQILTTLREEGYIAPHHSKLYYYNAYLAARAAQGKLLLEEKMDDLTAAALLEEAAKRNKPLKSVASELTVNRLGSHYLNELKARYLHDKEVLVEIWLKTTIKVIQAVDADDCEDILREKGLCPETVESVAVVSQWREMIDGLREHVMSKRTAGVLRDLGTLPVIEALKGINDALSRSEEIIQGDEATAQQEYEASKNLLETFSEEAEEVLEDRFLKSIDKAFANDYYDEVVLKAIRPAAENAAKEVFENTGFWAQAKNLWDRLCGGDSLEIKCQRIISDAYQDALYTLGNKWSLGLEDNEIYRTQIRRSVRSIQKELKALWDKLRLPDDKNLKKIDPVNLNLSGSISKDVSRIDIPEINTALSMNYFINDAMTSVDVGLTTFIAGSWVYVYLLPASFIIPGFGAIMAVVAAAIGAIVFAFSKNKRQKRIDNLADEIKTELMKSVTEEKDGIISNIIEGRSDTTPPQLGVSFIRKFYLNTFNVMLDNQKKALEADHEQKRTIFRFSTEHRRQIADKARKWRTEKIAPLREAITKILAKIEGIWGTTEA